MKTFKGTKGNWAIKGKPYKGTPEEQKNYGYHGQFTVYSGKTTVVNVNAYSFWNLKYREAQANAKLIAAAPELLDACIDLIDSLQPYLMNCEAIMKAKKAINKAL